MSAALSKIFRLVCGLDSGRKPTWQRKSVSKSALLFCKSVKKILTICHCIFFLCLHLFYVFEYPEHARAHTHTHLAILIHTYIHTYIYIDRCMYVASSHVCVCSVSSANDLKYTNCLLASSTTGLK